MDMSSPQALVPVLTEMGNQLMGTKYASVAMLALFLYDYTLTFADELELIWKRKFTLVTFLFIINRYYALFAFIVCIAALTSPLFTPEVCNRFSRFFPYAAGTPLTFFPDIVIGLRVYALYGRNRMIGASLTVYILAEFAVAMWIYGTPGSHPLELPPFAPNTPTFHLCVEETADSLGNLRSAVFQFMQTIYDTAIFGLIVYKTVKGWKEPGGKSSLRVLMVTHGMLYYVVLFSTNLTWALMILLAPPGIKYAAASPTALMGCTIVNRMTMSMRNLVSSDRNNAILGYAHRRDANRQQSETLSSDRTRSNGTRNTHGIYGVANPEGEGIELGTIYITRADDKNAVSKDIDTGSSSTRYSLSAQAKTTMFVE